MSIIEGALQDLGFPRGSAEHFLELAKYTGINSPLDSFSDSIPHHINSLAQKHWLRPKGSERWEIVDDKAISANREKILYCLSALGFVQTVAPTLKTYNHALLLSAIAPRFERRFDYFSTILSSGVQVEDIYLLGSARELIPGLEDHYIERLGKNANELEMLNYICENYFKSGKLSRNINVISVNAPNVLLESGLKRRANTEEQIHNWLLRNPSPGTVLSVSCQPYVLYQGATIRSVIDSHASNQFSICSVGQEIHSNEKIRVILDSFARYIYTKCK